MHLMTAYTTQDNTHFLWDWDECNIEEIAFIADFLMNN